MALKDEIAASGVAKLEAGSGGLEKIVIDAPAARGEMYLHGAHVTSFTPRGQKPVIFLSKDSLYQPDKPIRGGVPICFPWFGPKADDRAAPMHGVARISPWKFESIERVGDGARAVLSLVPNEVSRKYWPHEFAARFIVTFGATLEMSLLVQNTGRSHFTYQEALHSYLTVGDVRKITLTGLERTKYLDKVTMETKVEGDAPIRITGETDRVYLGTTASCVVDDPGLRRKLSVEKSGSNVTVVWNPWIDRSKALADFGDQEWPGMLCVETANTADFAIQLAPGESHTIRAIVRVD